MNNRSIFNISILEIMLILFFMFISISIYQLTYKNNQISELTQTVNSEREILNEIVQKNYPKLENRIDNLVNLEKCKKENIILKNKDTGLNYLTNKLSQDVKNADTRKYAKKYNELQNEKIELNAQLATLKGNSITINLLTQLHQQDKPLHQQIITLEQKVKDNYKNRMILVNKIKKLKSDGKVKYILAKLDKNDAPLHEQITAIGKELNQLNRNRLGKNHNTNTTYVLDNLNQNNLPITQQIDVLKQSLENKNLLLEIDNLKKQLAKNLKTGNENLNIKNMKQALNNLENIKNNPSQPYNPNTKNILKKMGMNNEPLNKQINNLKNTLDLDKQLNKQLANNLNTGHDNLNTNNIIKALNNLDDIKNNHTNSYTPNTKNVLKQLDMYNKPLDRQINTLENKLDLDKRLTNQLAKNLKIGNDNLDQANLKKALDNLQKIQNKDTNTYEPNSKDILKKLDINNKPLLEQINKLKNKLDLDKKLKEQLANNLKADNENLNTNDLKKALNNLHDIKNNNANSYNPNSKDVLKKMGMSNMPLNEQINKLKKRLALDKQLKEQLANNLKTKNNNLDRNSLKKALANLRKMKNKNTNSYDQNSKIILNKMGITNIPLDEQIYKIEDKLDKDKKINKQVKILEKQIDINPLLKNSNISKEDIKKALNNLKTMRDTNTNTHTNADKVYINTLKNALDSIKEIEKIKNKLSNKKNTKPTLNKSINNTIKYLEDKINQPNLKATKDVQATLDKFDIKGKPTSKQLSNLYLNLYSIPSNNTNVSELNFVIKRLNHQNDLNNRVKNINNFLEKTTNTTTNNFIKNNEDTNDGKDRYSKKEIDTLKNQIKYLQKKIEKNGVTHLPCFIDDEGSSIFLFILSLRDDNIHIELGKHESVPELAEGLPNMDKLVGKTMSLKKFMKLTKPIFEKTVQDECRHFVYFEDETISKREYKRKTLTIQHHFYKYIDHRW